MRKYIGKIMIEYFKSLWMRITKTTPSDPVPVSEKISVEIIVKDTETIPPAPKISKPRRKYVRKATTH